MCPVAGDSFAAAKASSLCPHCQYVIISYCSHFGLHAVRHDAAGQKLYVHSTLAVKELACAPATTILWFLCCPGCCLSLNVCVIVRVLHGWYVCRACASTTCLLLLLAPTRPTTLSPCTLRVTSASRQQVGNNSTPAAATAAAFISTTTVP